MRTGIKVWIDKGEISGSTVGEFNPSEINHLVKLVKKFGVKSNGKTLIFQDAYYSYDHSDYHIVVE